MDREYLFDAFKFYDYFFLYYQIKTIAGIQLNPFVTYGELSLAFKYSVAALQFMAQTFLINRFEKPWAKASMNFNGCLDNLFS